MRGRTTLRRELVLTMLVIVTPSGCASEDKRDPLEGMNRAFFGLNEGLDKVIGQPVSDVYVVLLPEPVRDGLHNGLDNVGYFNVILNQFLQGKIDEGFQDSGRMLVNSTLGIAGIFDVATGMGLERHDEDFGQTLAVWGVGQGIYLVLPLLGPTTLRDVWSIPVAIGTNPLFYLDFGTAAIVVGGFKAVDGRARADEQLRQLEEAALDPYVFTREAFLARREFLVHDKDPPSWLDDLYEDFDDEELDDGVGNDEPQESGSAGGQAAAVVAYIDNPVQPHQDNWQLLRPRPLPGCAPAGTDQAVHGIATRHGPAASNRRAIACTRCG